MKSAQTVEGAYWMMMHDGRCFEWSPRLHEFEKQEAQELLGNDGTECTRWMQKPRLTIFRVAVIAVLVARQIPFPQSTKSISDLTLFVFVFTTLPASSFLSVNAQRGRFIVEQTTVSESAHFAFCNCPNARFQTHNLRSGDRVTWRQSPTR
ncbi:uncharacterized protein LACBIDRAFT_310894 [Laccaria bicolor S238N-H82]|uniref:Predicted protein n=1 Tax=Laccaria bicolor (strain S238N-H82 / ATCC MYA-4686) TaxID=486041 RepID=B0DVB9_LACBS|nr:uncharacterized protein LACBIDRAFT_310894 [Laccaria bicolor S238N-H82]EDR01486.1 predicted protein [Laccaria bicolor S238N-H82]|eukprot:XP_001887838.1 predicted protein [Laccaria bicolor S238N-H82]